MTNVHTMEIKNQELFDRIRAEVASRKIIPLTAKERKVLAIFYATWRNMLWKRIRQYQAIITLYVGKKGSGKSYAAISDALEVDPFFTIEQIIFSKEEAEEQFDRLRESKNQYPDIPRVVIWDEAGIGMYNREWYQKEQIQIIKKLLAIRTTGINVFCCVPHLQYVDSALDGQIIYMIEMEPPEEDRLVRFGKILKPFGFHSIRKPLKFIPIRGLEKKRFFAPYVDPQQKNPQLFDHYEVLRSEYASALLKRDQHEKSDGVTMTSRQLEYQHLIIRGHTNREIATDLHVSIDQVKDMKRLLRQKGAIEPLED